MFKNNLKIAWRNLMKDRQFTFLNLLGLATGLTCTILIYLWVHDEYQFDKFHEKDARLYQLMEHRKGKGEVFIADESSGILARNSCCAESGCGICRSRSTGSLVPKIYIECG